jgi:hypothetical protein
MKRLKSLYGLIPIPGGKRGCGESHPFIYNGSDITLPGEGYFASRSGISSTFGFFVFSGFSAFFVVGKAWDSFKASILNN